jgi:Fe-S cluster biogenesis protein NfuA
MSKERETKRDKFVRLAEARTNKIIDMIQLLGNCSNANAYNYTQRDVEKIFKAIQTEMDEARKRFNKMESNNCSRFSLE